MKKNEYWLATMMTIADMLDAFAVPLGVIVFAAYVWISLVYVWFCPLTIVCLVIWMIISTFRTNLRRVRLNNDA